eukprot:62374-Rhodomonas_salina.1
MSAAPYACAMRSPVPAGLSLYHETQLFCLRSVVMTKPVLTGLSPRDQGLTSLVPTGLFPRDHDTCLVLIGLLPRDQVALQVAKSVGARVTAVCSERNQVTPDSAIRLRAVRYWLTASNTANSAIRLRAVRVCYALSSTDGAYLLPGDGTRARRRLCSGLYQRRAGRSRRNSSQTIRTGALQESLQKIVREHGPFDLCFDT